MVSTTSEHRNPSDVQESDTLSPMPWPREQPVLAGEHVLLRAVTEADIDAIYSACQDRDIQHFTQVPVPYGRADAETFVRLCRDRWHDGVTANFAICDRDSGQFLGIVGIIEANLSDRTAGLGYWTAAWGRSRGATSEAVRLATQWAFRHGELSMLVAEAEPSNPASVKILAGAGFVRQDGADYTIELKGTTRTFQIWRARATAG